MLAVIRSSVVFSDAPEIWPITRFQLDQFLYQSSIFVALIDWIHPPCNRGVCVFSHIWHYNFPCLQEGDIPLVLHFYFFFFFIDIARSWISRIVLSAVWTFLFVWALFLRMVWVLFAAFYTCQSSSAILPVMFILLTFEASQWYWNILFNSLVALADVHYLGNMGQIKCHDVGVGLDLLTTLSDCNSFGVGHSQFSLGSCHLFCYSQRYVRTYDSSLRSVQSLDGICLSVESFFFILRMF